MKGRERNRCRPCERNRQATSRGVPRGISAVPTPAPVMTLSAGEKKHPQHSNHTANRSILVANIFSSTHQAPAVVEVCGVSVCICVGSQGRLCQVCKYLLLGRVFFLLSLCAR